MKPFSIILGATLLCASAVPAFAQDVLMRRPLPRSATSASQPSSPSVPQAACADGQQQIVSNATWVANGWSNGDTSTNDSGDSCVTQNKIYVCQVQVACVGGASQADLSIVETDDSVCENFQGDVGTFDPDQGPQGPSLSPAS